MNLNSIPAIRPQCYQPLNICRFSISRVRKSLLTPPASLPKVYTKNSKRTSFFSFLFFMLKMKNRKTFTRVTCICTRMYKKIPTRSNSPKIHIHWSWFFFSHFGFTVTPSPPPLYTRFIIYESNNESPISMFIRLLFSELSFVCVSHLSNFYVEFWMKKM